MSECRNSCRVGPALRTVHSLSTDVVVVLCKEGEAPLAQLVSVVDLTGLQDPGQEFTKN